MVEAGGPTSARRALLIGTSQYRDRLFGRLQASTGDVQELEALLRDRDIGGFDEVVTLVNRPHGELRREIARFFANRHRGELLLLYFSCHGVLDDRGQLYLAAIDTEHDLLSATAVPAAFLREEIDNCRSQRQVLVLDCCHGAAFARGAKRDSGVGTAQAFEGNGYGRVVLTASDSTQFAWEGDKIVGTPRRSVFTHFVIEGLKTGAADVDRDGKITVDDLYEYVFYKIQQSVPKQTPSKFTYKQQGDIVLAQAVGYGSLYSRSEASDDHQGGPRLIWSRVLLGVLTTGIGAVLVMAVLRHFQSAKAAPDLPAVTVTQAAAVAAPVKIPVKPAAEATPVGELAERELALGDYAEALRGFREAFKQSGDVRFLRRIGDTWAEEGNKADAAQAYRNYLARASAGEDKRQVELVMASLTAPPATRAKPSSPPVAKATLAKPKRSQTEARATVASYLAEAKRHYEQGLRYYDVDNYLAAIGEFEKAYEVGGDPRMLYNLAQAHRLAGHASMAINFYRRYILKVPNAPNVQAVLEKIRALEEAAGELKKKPTE
jgi:hypothetical protein